MIAYVQTFEDLRNWARGRAAALEAAYEANGDLVTLGYLMALRDVVRSELGADVTVPNYQRAIEMPEATVTVLQFPEDRAAA